MASGITKDEILHLAELARIGLSEAEITEFQGEFSAILGYVDELKEITQGEERKEVGPHQNVLREDSNPHEAGLYSDALLDAAPGREDNYVRVKKILQDE